MQDMRKKLELSGRTFNYYSLNALAEELGIDLNNLPFSLRVIMENALRSVRRHIVDHKDLKVFADWLEARGKQNAEAIAYMPARVLLQDFTGVPVVADLAAMRARMEQLGRDPRSINPVVRSDMVIDHSIQVDEFASADALANNIKFDYGRNGERYSFLKWAQKSFDNLNIVPPGVGIVHQVNIEHLASVVSIDEENGELYSDTCVGTDSHTTMVNGLSVLAWGVGGIEAEAVMLGQPYFMALPEVIGVNMIGELREGVTATDLVLSITARLRAQNVVGKFVEFYGPGITKLPVTDRTTIGNMAPEYGATCGFFPIDSQTIDYLAKTGRSEEQLELVEKYARENHLWHTADSKPLYTDTLEIDLSEVESLVAGPNKPQDKLPLAELKDNFSRNFPPKKSTPPATKNGATAEPPPETLPYGAVVIAAITSCTNTSNPAVMVGAGLLARNAYERGLRSKPWVKTSLAPGSKVVTEYLRKSKLQYYLDRLGFNTVGYGCTTCIGNSGPLDSAVAEEIERDARDVVAVLSGNRNFEGRVHPLVKASYLASPLLVVAYALTGMVDKNIATEPLGNDDSGKPVYLKDIWPSHADISEITGSVITPEMYKTEYSKIYEGTKEWNELEAPTGITFAWADESSYIKCPPYFDGIDADENPNIKSISGARVLVKLGDHITTDHISPAGSIPTSTPAGQYLRDSGLRRVDFNTFGARRGNHEVMVRGTFGNIRLRNQLTPEEEGDRTLHLPSAKKMHIYEASLQYKRDNVDLIVLAGKNYGSGSSRDWAAKGPMLLGVKAVIAESYERIHRSNLVGMGILPLQYIDGENAESLGLTGHETYQISGQSTKMKPRAELSVVATTEDGERKKFRAIARLDQKLEIEYYRYGGILPYVLLSKLRDED